MICKIIVDRLPCEAVQTPMAALSSGRSAPRSLTAQTKPPSGHAAPLVQPRPKSKKKKKRRRGKKSKDAFVFLGISTGYETSI